MIPHSSKGEMDSSQMASAPLSDIATAIELREEGFWAAKRLSKISFPADGNRYCFAVEDSSFWFEHRNECILDTLSLFPPNGRFFDIGGGNGFVANAIQTSGRDVVLIEPDLDGVRNAHKRGIRQIIWGTVEEAGLRQGTMPAIGLFDVLEHIEDDVGFLRKLYALQPRSARIYLTVPALQPLWSNEDRLAGHRRRYSLKHLSGILEDAGYRVEFATCFFGFLILPIFLFRVIPYRFGMGRKTETEAGVRADHQPNQSATQKLLRCLMSRERARIAQGAKIRFGSSCLIVAQK
jgi:hypothetical protein